MNTPIIIDPTTEYYVISLAHTHRKDKYITLWRPDNKGYCWPLPLAGTYLGYQHGYHNNFPEIIPIHVTQAATLRLIKDDQNRLCIANTPKNREKIKEFYVKNLEEISKHHSSSLLNSPPV